MGNPDAVEQIIRSLLFYTVTNLEAFIFCFAGEYLSNKVTIIMTKFPFLPAYCQHYGGNVQQKVSYHVPPYRAEQSEMRRTILCGTTWKLKTNEISCLSF